jgi:hypothetical protein
VSAQIHTYDPENWLESVVRTLREYAEHGFDNAVKDNGGDPVGDTVYEVVMEFPSNLDPARVLPMDRTLIHFEIDDIVDMILGFGDNIIRENFNESDYTVRPQEARVHRINFDVGIWASDRSGGTTQRLRAYQVLANLFHGSRARAALWNASTEGDGGIEILEFTGGRFLTERTGDIPLYRMVDCQLEIRVYSRTPIGEPEAAVETVVQAPGLSIPD